MPRVSVDDASVYYTTAGSGPGLVLVHGTQGTGETNWAHLTDRFTDVRTVVALDYAGSGQTTDDGGDLTVEKLSDEVAAVASEAVDGPVDMVGFSLGAVVAAATAARRPDLVRRLVVLAGWPHGDNARHRLNFELWRDLAATDFATFNRFATVTGFTDEYLRGLGHEGVAEALAVAAPQPGLVRQIELDLRVDIRPLLPKITAPTLVIGCTRDQMVPVQGPRDLHEAIPGSTYAELDTGHLAIYEKPDELTTLIRDFILSG